MTIQPIVDAQGMSLLQTKFYIPPQRRMQLARPRLIERLNAGSHRILTLISAPAGFGKTTLVIDWLNGRSEGADRRLKRRTASDLPTANNNDPRVAWLSLDEGDNDTVRFLTYFVAGLQTIDPQQEWAGCIGKDVLCMLQSQQPASTEVVLTSLLNEIAAFPNNLIYVLDDFHLIDAQPIYDAVTFLLEHQPPQMHLVIATREDPPLSLARLRAQGQLTELRAADLRFTLSEATDFLNQMMGLNLSAEDIAALETRTEGWVAGLQLAALVLRGQPSTQSDEATARFINSFTGSHRFILDYLIEEVLERQSESVQSFLLQTAILDRLTGSLCEAVCAGGVITDLDSSSAQRTASGQATLEMLEHANLFIVPLDEEQHWYRYHHLFAELLRHLLRQAHPEKLPILHIRAGEWFNRQGMSREAMKHFLAAKEYQRAAKLIRALAIDMMQQGEHTTVVGWINALPEEFVKEEPYVCVLHAWALMLAGQLEITKARLIDAEHALDNSKKDDEDADVVIGLISSHRSYLAFMSGEHEKTISYARQALDQLPINATLIRAQTGLYLGVAYRFRGQLQAALDVYNKILPIAQTMGDKSIAVSCYLHLAELVVEMAQLRRAREICDQALKFTEQHTGRPERPYSGYIYVSIGRILRQWNQLEDAYRFTTKGVDLCHEWNEADIVAMSYIELAYINRALGDDRQANVAIQKAIHIYDGFSSWASKYAAAHQARIDLDRGDIEAAVGWAQTNELDLNRDFEFHREIEYLVLSRVFIAQKRYDEAYTLIERIYRIALELGKRQTELEALILLALVCSAQGENDQALVHLKKALSIGEFEEFIRIFVDEGPPMAHLLYTSLSHKIAPDYVSRLLAAFPIVEPEPAGLSEPQSKLLEMLSERELEVLQLIADGLTNSEIAARLFLSLSTVKGHNSNIYGKLDVHSRTQAIARAQGLGLISRK